MISKASANTLEESTSFFVDNSYDSGNRQEIQASLKKISLHGYFYVEDEYYNDLNKSLQNEFDNNLSNLSADFDLIIYPRMRNVFGTEWNPGIDNDGKIVILLTKTKENVGGYFNPSDEYFKEEITNGISNEKEMIYLNATFLGNKRIKSFLAHEFQHMITWYHKTKLQNITDDIWLNEARSEYASTAIGYDDNYQQSNLKARIENFQTDPIDSITDWQNKIYDYASVNLFSQYLTDRFGKDIFKKMIDNDKVGISSINKAFVSLGFTDVTFKDVFVDWTIANYLNDKVSFSTDIYSYKNENISFNNFHVPIVNSFEIDNDVQKKIYKSVKDWSGAYFEFMINDIENNKTTQINLSFDGQNNGKFSVPYIIIFKDGAKEVNYLSLDNAQDSVLNIANTNKKISSIIVIPISDNKSSAVGSSVASYDFSLAVENVTLKTFEDNSLLRQEDEQKVYLIENGQKRWISSAAVFISNGYDWKNIVTVSKSELGLYPQGKDVSAIFDVKPNGTLLKDSRPMVYLIENGQKRWISSAAVFISNGYDWKNIVTVSKSELGLYPQGKDI